MHAQYTVFLANEPYFGRSLACKKALFVPNLFVLAASQV